MTTNLINHLRSIMSRSDWDFHGPSIERMVAEASQPDESSWSSVIDRDIDARGPVVYVDGSVLRGFNIIGPFNTVDDAAEWAIKKTLPGLLGVADGVIMMLESPRVHEVAFADEQSFVKEQGECYGSS